MLSRNPPAGIVGKPPGLLTTTIESSSWIELVMSGSGLFVPGRPVPDDGLARMDNFAATDARAFDLDLAALDARSPFLFG